MVSQKIIYTVIIILILVIAIAVVWRDRVFGPAYEPTTREVFNGNIEISELPQIKVNKTEARNGFRSFNPSVVVVGNKPMYFFRVSNCNRCKSFALPPKGTKESYIAMMYNDRVVKVTLPEVSHKSCIQGFEDSRSILSPDGTTIYLISNNRSRQTCTPEMWLIQIPVKDIFDATKKNPPNLDYVVHDSINHEYVVGESSKLPELEVSNVKQLVPVMSDVEEQIKPEKNWMPFFHNDELHFVYAVNPHTILKCDMKTGNCKIVAQTFNPELPENIRGGTQIKLYNGRYIGLTHIQKTLDSYLTQVYAFSAQYPFQVEAISQPFIFNQKRKYDSGLVQFVSGLDIIENEAHITYGHMDCDAKLCRMSMDVLEKALYEIDDEKLEVIYDENHSKEKKLMGISVNNDYKVGNSRNFK